MAAIDSARFLLLLPPPPSPPAYAAIKAAFRDSLVQVLKEAASHASESAGPAILEIALSCPHLVNSDGKARSALYDSTQKLVAALYRLTCAVATREGINVEDAEGVDVRVLLVAWSTDGAPSSKGPWQRAFGPVVDLKTLARSGRGWQFAFGVESESGEAMVKAFVQAKGSGEEVARVQGGPVMKQGATAASNSGSDGQTEDHDTGTSTAGDDAMQARRHHDVAVGGTFDHLHIGHKLLLTMTLFAVDRREAGCRATIGITGDKLLVNKKHAGALESWEERQQAVQRFVDAMINFWPSRQAAASIKRRDDERPNGKGIDVHYVDGLVCLCTEIQDPFGPTITEEQISALIISAETRSGGKAVNDKRRELGWAELEVLEVDVLDADDHGGDDDEGGGKASEGFESKISSTAIRGKIEKKKGGSGAGGR